MSVQKNKNPLTSVRQRCYFINWKGQTNINKHFEHFPEKNSFPNFAVCYILPSHLCYNLKTSQDRKER